MNRAMVKCQFFCGKLFILFPKKLLQPDFPLATGYFRPFCAAMLRRAVIIAAFVIAVALGL